MKREGLGVWFVVMGQGYSNSRSCRVDHPDPGTRGRYDRDLGIRVTGAD